MQLLVDARRPLLEGVLDYTWADRPSDLPLEEAVSIYRNAVSGPEGWIIGRFLCPTSRAEELIALLTASMRPGDRQWHVGSIFDEELGTAAMHASVFETYMSPAGSVTSVEAMTNDGAYTAAASLATAAAGISLSATAFVHIGSSEGATQIRHLAETSRDRLQPVGALLDAATVRSDPVRFAEVINTSVQLRVPFKIASPPTLATSGEFLRLVGATALAHRSGSFERMVAILSDDEPNAVTATAVGLRWQDQLWGVPDIKKARATLQSWNCLDLDAAAATFRGLGLLST